MIFHLTTNECSHAPVLNDKKTRGFPFCLILNKCDKKKLRHLTYYLHDYYSYLIYL